MRGIAQAWRRAALALLLCLQFVPAIAAQDAPPGIAVADLPQEARDTLHLILHEGPFPYARDGAVFGNHERRLPEQPYACTTLATKPETCASRCEVDADTSCLACTSDTLLTKSADCGRRCQAGAPAPEGSAPPCRARYREYTVKTPGVKTRGPRRIVCDEVLDCYYTADHYRTFSRILEQQ